MKMIKLFLLIFLCAGIVLADYVDTGFIEWQQPDSATFTARLVGDEFSSKFITNDGYEIRKGSDGWYYYAIISADKIIASIKKVGIDTPPSQSLNLEPTTFQVSQSESDLAQFKDELQEAAEWFEGKQQEASGGTVTLKIGVILVDFADSVHWKTNQGSYPFPNGYDLHYFNELIFSNDGTWFDDDINNPPTPHPENQKLFGSLRDYYNQQSLGKLDFTDKNGLAEILNPEDPLHPGIPDWVYLDEEKSYWESKECNAINIATWHAEARQKFEEKFSNISIDGYDRFIYIYAGGRGNSGSALWPAARPNEGYHMSERYLNNGFSHIGVHAHEFGHLLGAEDEYNGQTDPGKFAIMGGSGSSFGPNYGTCPSGFSPFYRTHWGWVEVTYLNETNYSGFELNYSYENPSYYRIDIPDDPTEYFLLEKRLRQGFDLWTPNDPAEVVQNPCGTTPPPCNPKDNQGGFLVWTIDEDNENHDKTAVKHMSSPNPIDLALPYITGEVNGDGENLTQNTYPDNSLRNITNPGVEFLNISWDDSDASCTIDITHDYGSNNIVISQNEIWYSTHTVDKDIYIMGGATLTLNAGIVLQMANNSKITIMEGGTLEINGTYNNQVELIKSGSNWKGIELLGSVSQITGQYFKIKNARNAISISKSGDYSFQNIYFENNNHAFSINSSSLIEGEAIFTNCFFKSSGIQEDQYGGNPYYINFENCTFYNSSVNLNGTLDSNIKNSIFYQSNLRFDNEIIDNSVSYSCFYNSTLNDNTGNFLTNPEFVNIGNNDFHLLETSPCIDAGDPGSEYSNEPGENGSRINIGAYGNTIEATETNTSNPPQWSGVVKIGGDISISSILSIQPGSNISFPAGTELKIDGNLQAAGNSTNKITFTRSGSSDTWSGIKVNGSANIDNAIIEYAGQGVSFLNSSTGTILNSELRNNNYGIFVNTALPTIQSCNIHNNNGRGIYIYNTNSIGSAGARTQILNNQIHHNGTYGIDLYKASPSIQNTEINNQTYGIYGYGNCSPYLGQYGVYGYNNIHDNTYGIGVISSSNPFLGEENCVVNGGYNQIIAYTYHVAASYYCYVQAEQNWWGSSSPQSSKFYATNSSIIDYTPCLPSSPFGAMMNISSNEESEFDKAFNAETFAAETEIDFMNYFDSKWPIEHKLLFARNIYLLGDIKNSQEICKDIIANFPDSTLSFFALDILWQSSRDSKPGSDNDLAAFKKYLTKLSSNKEKKELYGYSELLKAGFENDKSKSLLSVDNIYDIYKGTFLSEIALYQKFIYYFHEEKNIEMAKKVSLQLNDEFPNSISALKADDLLKFSSINQNNNLSKSVSDIDKVSLILDKYNISSNYPNPFNPSTRFEYVLPKLSNVQFMVYNTLGQKLKVFKKFQQPKGNFTFTWNGINDAGAQMPTGLYILRFTAESLEADKESFTKSIKMLLIR